MPTGSLKVFRINPNRGDRAKKSHFPLSLSSGQSKGKAHEARLGRRQCVLVTRPGQPASDQPSRQEVALEFP